MLIVTNRNIRKTHLNGLVGDDQVFGESINDKGPSEIRLAWANRDQNGWLIDLIPEPDALTADNLPSKNVFIQLRESLQSRCQNCLFFIHGFNQSFVESMEKAHAIETLYGVEVVLFSWPSNAGGFATQEYRLAKRAAMASATALDATITKLAGYLTGDFDRRTLQSCRVKVSLMAYSLGNLMFKNYIQNAEFEPESNVFENVILCQADVDNKGHARWVDQIHIGKRVYITINENDWVLKWSDANFQRNRLGRTAQQLNAQKAFYVDFTDAPGVERKHGLFYLESNETVRVFFNAAINGDRAESVDGLVYDSANNAHRIEV